MAQEELKNGLLLVDKDAGGTSHDVVQRARRLLGQKKIGHCGTLDPNATGMLVLTVGRATRLTRFLIRAPKVYLGTIRFGAATDTYDADGEVTSEGPTEGLAIERIGELMAGFVGSYQQVPPPYSAKKFKGKKLYELARKGEELPEQEPKPVAIYELDPVGELVDDRLSFRLACASGTYARSVVHDLGQQLGCGAYLEQLRRTAVGPFAIDRALSLDSLADCLEAGREPEPAWVPFDEIPLPFSEITADAQQEQRISHGQTVLVRQLDSEEGDWVKLINRRNRFIAVGTVVERIGAGGVGVVRPRVVFK